jgi:hypothetical protein
LLKILNKEANNLINKWAVELNKYLLPQPELMMNKHMEKCSASLAIKEMQSKNKQIPFYPVRMAISKETNDKGWQELG